MVVNVSELEALWKKQHSKSNALFEEAKKVTPGGAHHTMMIDKWHTERGVYPFYVTRADGVKVHDIDGNVYTDYFSHAALFLGHNNPEVVKAIQEYAALGPFSHDFTEINLKLCKKIIKMVPCADIVDFVNSGTEANEGVQRIVRAYTKRKKIIRFDGHFHGWTDQLIANRTGIPEEVYANTVTISERDISILEKAVEQHNPAAVIFHFVYGSGGGGMAMGDENPKEFMKAMREITSKHGVPLIADEVVTGFRLAPGGAQQYFGIDVDLTTLGKMVCGAIGGSGAIVGKEEIMQIADPKRHPPAETPLTGGTFSGNPMHSAAGYAALDVIDKAGGRLNEQVNKLGERLREGLNELFQRHKFPAQAVGCGSCNGVAFTDKLPIKSVSDFKETLDREKLYKWHMYLAVHYKIYTYPGGGAFYLMTPHTKEDIDLIIKGTEEYVKKEK